MRGYRRRNSQHIFRARSPLDELAAKRTAQFAGLIIAIAISAGTRLVSATRCDRLSPPVPYGQSRQHARGRACRSEAISRVKSSVQIVSLRVPSRVPPQPPIWTKMLPQISRESGCKALATVRFLRALVRPFLHLFKIRTFVNFVL
jgi:hypothetical protein